MIMLSYDSIFGNLTDIEKKYIYSVSKNDTKLYYSIISEIPPSCLFYWNQPALGERAVIIQYLIKYQSYIHNLLGGMLKDKQLKELFCVNLGNVIESVCEKVQYAIKNFIISDEETRAKLIDKLIFYERRILLEEEYEILGRWLSFFFTAELGILRGTYDEGRMRRHENLARTGDIDFEKDIGVNIKGIISYLDKFTGNESNNNLFYKKPEQPNIYYLTKFGKYFAAAWQQGIIFEKYISFLIGNKIPDYKKFIHGALIWVSPKIYKDTRHLSAFLHRIKMAILTKEYIKEDSRLERLNSLRGCMECDIIFIDKNDGINLIECKNGNIEQTALLRLLGLSHLIEKNYGIKLNKKIIVGTGTIDDLALDIAFNSEDIGIFGIRDFRNDYREFINFLSK